MSGLESGLKPIAGHHCVAKLLQRAAEEQKNRASPAWGAKQVLAAGEFKVCRFIHVLVAHAVFVGFHVISREDI